MSNFIAKINLKNLTDILYIQAICAIGYQKTGNKFSVNFNGSKGYLDNIEIVSEGVQKDNDNIIPIQDYLTQKGTLKSRIIQIWHEDESGVIIFM